MKNPDYDKKATELVLRIMKDNGATFNSIGPILGMRPQSVRNKKNRDSWTFAEIMKLVEYFEGEISISYPISKVKAYVPEPVITRTKTGETASFKVI